MKLILASAMAATLALGAAPLAAEDGAEVRTDSRAERGEARLAEMLEGRVAGEGRSCISAMNSNRIQVIEHVGIVYEGGGTIWVARADQPRSLGAFDVPIIERHGSQLCRTDIIRTVDRSTGMHSGVVFLGDFVPYTRADQG